VEVHSENPPDNYLVWAIITTVLCCLPLGIVAIVKSSKVNTLWAQGDYEGALKESASAKLFVILAATIGFIVQLLFLVPFLIFVFGDILANY
jgi:hypothetical protein